MSGSKFDGTKGKGLGGWICLIGAVALVVSLPGCGIAPDYVTDSEAAVLLIVTQINEGGPILSDVRKDGSIVNCDTPVEAVVNVKNANVTEDLPQQKVVLSRYEVQYFRSDGLNTEGVDVPYRITGPLSVTVRVNNLTSFPLTIVRHQAKLEPPLSNLADLDLLTVSAKVTLYGETIYKDGVSASGTVQITFADYATGTTSCEG